MNVYHDWNRFSVTNQICICDDETKVWSTNSLQTVTMMRCSHLTEDNILAGQGWLESNSQDCSQLPKRSMSATNRQKTKLWSENDLVVKLNL